MSAGRPLAKLLFDYLSAADVEIGTLRSLGWFDFLRFAVPDTTDARIVAGTAIHWLLVSSNGTQVVHDDRIIYATLAFVRGVRGGELPTIAASASSSRRSRWSSSRSSTGLPPYSRKSGDGEMIARGGGEGEGPVGEATGEYEAVRRYFAFKSHKVDAEQISRVVVRSRTSCEI